MSPGSCPVGEAIHHLPSIIHHPSSIIHHPSSIIHHPSSIIHHPSLIIDRPSLIIDRPSLIIDRPSLIIDRPSLIIDRPSLIVDRLGVSPGSVAIISFNSSPHVTRDTSDEILVSTASQTCHDTSRFSSNFRQFSAAGDEFLLIFGT